MTKLIQAPRSALKSGSKSPYCPDAGDIIWLNFEPQAGREITKVRPALVLSPRLYNSQAGLCIACPITSTVRNYPLETALPTGLKVEGVVLADQIKSLSWKARRAKFIAHAPPEVLEDVRAKVAALIQL